MRLFGPACLVLLLAVAACNKPAKNEEKVTTPVTAVTAPAGFAHDPDFDAAGYYRTATPVQSGIYRLNQLSVGAPSDFAQWEAGKREGIYGPIILQFDDMTSPTQANELGADVHAVTLRVLPTSYRLYPGEVNFAADDAKLGKVTFDGKFDQAVFADAHKTGTSGDATVLTGDLSIGDQTVRDIKFVFWAGD